MRLYGLGGLGIADTDTVPANSNITFGVSGGPCGFATEQGVRDTLTNWMSAMMQVNTVTTNWSGLLPLHLSVTVTATVLNDIAFGDLRGQIAASVAAYSQTQCASSGTLTITDNTVNYAPGGGGGGGAGGNPDTSVSWPLIGGAAALIAVVVLTRR